jgi:type VI protein secretion system component VasK
MSPSIRMAFEIVAPVFGVALALTLMLSVDRVREHRAHEMAWTFIWVSVCLVGALVFGGFAAFVAWQGFRDADARILDGGVVVAMLAVAVCLVYLSRHRRVSQSGRANVPDMAPIALERRQREQSHPLPVQIDSLAVVTGRYESARELAAHDAEARKELVDYLGRQIARREFGDPEAQVIDGYILAVFESRAGFGNQG